MCLLRTVGQNGSAQKLEPCNIFCIVFVCVFSIALQFGIAMQNVLKVSNQYNMIIL